MKSLKQLIARIFGIKPEDIQSRPGNLKLDDETKAVIRSEIEKHLDQALKENIIPEIRKAIRESILNPDINIQEQANNQQTHPEIADDKATGLNQEFPEIVEDVHPPSSRLPEIEPVSPDVGDLASVPILVEEEVIPLDEEVKEIPETRQPSAKDWSTSDRPIRLGIDFGTTTTAVSIRIGDEKPIALPIGSDGVTAYIPSVVYFRPGAGSLEERVLVGDDALSTNDEVRIIRSVKRCFACQGNACKIQQKNSNKVFPWCNGDGTIRIGEEASLRPSQIAYFILREALKRALQIVEDRWNINIKTSQLTLAPVNLGCGANFNLEQRTIILEIAKELGFEEAKIQNVVEEPILAGFAFSRFAPKPEGRSVIFDFGGGTLDVAVVDVDRVNGKQPRVTVLGTAGDNWLGGDDIDTLIYGEFLSQIQTSIPIVPDHLEKSLEAIDRAALLKMAKVAKERLSSTDLFRDSLLLEQLGPVTLSLNKERFEFLLSESGIITRSHEAMLRALKLAFALEIAKETNLLDVSKIHRLPLDQAVELVDRVVLVGGVTKIPYVREGLVKLFGRGKVVEEKVIEPVSAVAIGAAYPREVEHFSISSPPYGFYLEYSDAGRNGRISRHTLVKPFTSLDFYRMLHANAVPSHCVPVNISADFRNVKLVGKRAGAAQAENIESIGFIKPGNCLFHICLDGTLVFVDGDMKPIHIGKHPFTHPLQDKIVERRQKRYHEENRYEKSLEQDRNSIYNEN